MSSEGAQRILVVNADDFGWSRSVNDGIVEAHVDGIVTRASIMAPGSAFGHAAELARSTPGLGIGVHLSFYRGASTLPQHRVASLVGPDGMFLGSWQEIVARIATGRFDLSELRDELDAQIRLVRDAGLVPRHLDSEKHLHLWPSVFDLVCRLAREHGIPEVRVVREPPSAGAIPLGLGVLSSRDARIARRCGLAVADGTIGVTVPPADARTLARMLARARGHRVELVCHPGRVDHEFMELQRTMPNRLVCSREEELAALAGPAARTCVHDAGFVLERAGSRPPAQ